MVMEVEHQRAADVLVQDQQVLQRVAVGYVIILRTNERTVGRCTNGSKRDLMQFCFSKL